VFILKYDSIRQGLSINFPFLCDLKKTQQANITVGRKPSSPPSENSRIQIRDRNDVYEVVTVQILKLVKNLVLEFFP